VIGTQAMTGVGERRDLTGPERSGGRWWAVVGGTVGSLALVMISTDVAERLPRSYASSSASAHTLLLTAGATALLVGTVACLLRPRELAGRVTLGVALAWLAVELVGWAEGPAWLPTAAMVLAPWSMPLLTHLAFTFPGAVISSTAARVLVVGMYAAAAVVSVAAVTIYDPFFDVDCWRTCANAPFVVTNQPEWWDAIRGAWLRFVVVAGVIVAVRAGAGAARRLRWPPSWTWAVLVPVAIAAVAESVLAAALLTRTEDPEEPWFATLFAARAAALIALAVGTTLWFVRLAVQRRALAALADELTVSTPGRLRNVLARTLGDDSVDVVYWSPALRRYVDGDGRLMEHPTGSDRTIVSVERDGQHLGVVTQDSSLAGPDVADQIGAAARLAFDNARLRAEQLAQIVELRASRSRIVQTGDETRQRIERDLHDGAQQRLLALSFELRLAASSSAASGEEDARRELDLAGAHARAAIDELRELAHGIFPAVLTTAGLPAALDAVRDDAGVPLELDVPAERLDPRVEMAAYLAVVESVHAAAVADVAKVSVVGHVRGDELCVVVEWSDGLQPLAAFAHVADRVGALGGELRVSRTRSEVLLPCAPS
jgi:signal transduction histidine kinase